MVDGLRELKDAVADLRRDMNAQMSVLVSQREFDRTRDDLTIDIGEVRGQIAAGLTKHDTDIQHVKDQIALTRERHEADRKWAIGTAIAVVALLLTAIGLVINLLQH